MNDLYIHNFGELKYRGGAKGDIIFPAQCQKNEEGLVATIPCSQAPPRSGFLRRGGSPPPPPPPNHRDQSSWDQGSWAWLQGNAATNPFHSSEIEWEK